LRDRFGTAASIDICGVGGEADMRRVAIVWTGALIVACCAAACPSRALAITPDNPGAANVRFTVDSAMQKPISPYIYGVNGTSLNVPQTLDRLGGNRWTGYNWETNASNAGRDWYYQNDTHMGTGPAGNAVAGALASASNNNRGLVVTVPMSGYVAGDTAGPVQWAETQSKSRFKQIVPLKGAPLSYTPTTSDGLVYTDEFVNWVEGHKGAADVLYSLDNEPGLWGEDLPSNWIPGVPPPCPPCDPNADVDPSPQGRTHGALHPYKPTFLELRDKTIETAAAIKSVNPEALVLGGVGYGWNDFVSLQGAPDMNSRGPVVDYDGNNNDTDRGEMSFYEYLLDSVKREDDARGLTAQGRTLMDVLDLHWYTEARTGTDPDTNPGVRVADFDNSTGASVRVQAARSLWDPTYTEVSWISKWGVGSGAGNFGQVKLLPRVQQDIDLFKPGTKIAMTEYNFGGSNHISGAIAQADALGIFGREGVFAASQWGLSSQQQFTAGAFKMYLDYDGASGNGQFGDMSIEANTDEISQSAVYASLDSADPTRMVVVAINRMTSARTTAIEVTSDLRFTSAEVYRLTSASSTPQRQADLPISLVNAFLYTMPASSITTFVLRAVPEGDFTDNGFVDGADLAAWTDGLGTSTGATLATGDYDGDHDVDGRDFLAWQRGVGTTPGAAAAVPEPTGLALIAGCLLGLAARRRA
jgi:hypothetical protein